MKHRLPLISAIAISVVAIVLSILSINGQKKMAWFDYNKIYNDCELKKKLETDLEKVVSARKSELDSLQLELTFMSNKVQSGQASNDELVLFEDQKNRFLNFQNHYEEENYRLKEQYFTQIRATINEKSKSYGEDHGYDYLFSAVGDGSLMYATQSEDVTEDFLNYVNK